MLIISTFLMNSLIKISPNGTCDPNVDTEDLTTLISRAINRHLKTIKILNRKICLKLWITHELLM